MIYVLQDPLTASFRRLSLQDISHFSKLAAISIENGATCANGAGGV
jgi:hypothetical protein